MDSRLFSKVNVFFFFLFSKSRRVSLLGAFEFRIKKSLYDYFWLEE